jgi:hypothetical protein
LADDRHGADAPSVLGAPVHRPGDAAVRA